MSPRLPRVTSAEMARAVERLGFRISRQSESHRIYRSDEGRRVTLPFHAGKTLHPKLLASILRDAGITADELREVL
ncbi:MAG: type II toxin-antitoxin system HicA family toxin [Chloroflexi bacterium]|nr:type II toxin-antitoxin system HicA family toxin [Chloroflexota bacterium]